MQLESQVLTPIAAKATVKEIKRLVAATGVSRAELQNLVRVVIFDFVTQMYPGAGNEIVSANGFVHDVNCPCHWDGSEEEKNGI